MNHANFNTLLLGQIEQTLGKTPNLSAEFQNLLAQVSTSYQQFESKIALRTDQLIASTSHAYSFLDSLNMGFIMCDVNPEVVLTNASMKRMLATKVGSEQADHTEWRLEKIDKVFQPAIDLKSLVSKSLNNNQVVECKAVDFGQHVLRLFIAPMINKVSQGTKQKIGVVVLVEDITEQKVLERSKEEFLSVASHELRTPLTAIRGNAALIKRYYANKVADQDMTEMIDDIHTSSIRLINIVNDFLDVSALEQHKIIMKPETVKLDNLTDEVVRELEHLCQAKGVTLVRAEDMTNLPAVKADRQRIKQVLYNLIGNAVKYTEHGSITVNAQADGRFVYTTVTDSGRGMSEESQRLLFRKFQQAGGSLLTRDTTKGTGLGLYISKLIVESSGGTIGLVSSALSKGSVFRFSLPRADSGSAEQNQR
jgi:signal transduction histidine kinase